MATLNFKHDLTAVFGTPVAENPTQVMVEAAYGRHAIHARYLTVEVQPHDLAAAVSGARAMGFRGFNLTIPHLDGLGMLINQGRLGVRYWTGVDPDRTVMRAALERVFGVG